MPIPVPRSTLPGIVGRCAQLYRLLASSGVSILEAKRMTFTEAAIALGRDISPADRLDLQLRHEERRNRAKTRGGGSSSAGTYTSRPAGPNDTPEIKTTAAKDETTGQVRRFEKGVAAEK